MQYVLYLHISAPHSLCAAPSMAVVCSSLISSFPFVLLRYCLCDLEMVPVAPVITGIPFAFTHQILISSHLLS